MEEEGDNEDIPSAISPSDEVEDDEDEEDPPRKKQKRRSGNYATASSPVKDAAADLEEGGMSSSGARSRGDWDEPLAAPPVSSAPPLQFARIPSVSLGSDDGVGATRLVMLFLFLCRVIFLNVGFRVLNFLASFGSYRSGGTSSPPHEVEHTSAPSAELTVRVADEPARAGGSMAPSDAAAAISADADLLDHVSIR